MATGIRLISTDFDGTLIDPLSDGRCVPALARGLADFKAGGGRWAMNTGRSLEHAVEGLALFGAPVEPDFILTHEREIHRLGPDRAWHDFGEWNAVCRRRHRELFTASGEIFQRVRKLISGARDVTLIEESGLPAGLVTADETVMDRVAKGLDDIREFAPEFSYQRNTIYLRFCHSDYNKGTALAELCRLIEVDREEVFAIGDHFNDLAMLDSRHARFAACPANAIPEVKTAVRAAGGMVAAAHWGEGAAEALAFFMGLDGTKKPAFVC